MRTQQQTDRLEHLKERLSLSKGIGPFIPPQIGNTSHCVNGAPVWLMQHTTMALAHNIALRTDQAKWGRRSFFFPWQSLKPDRRLIELEYFGLTPAEVKLINATDFNPLPANAKPSHWLSMQRANLEQIIRAGRPTYQISAQPVHRDEAFIIRVLGNSTADSESPRAAQRV